LNFNYFDDQFQTANFLDENFTTQKVHRIKMFADLLTKIERFDKHRYPIGIYLIDKELQSSF